MLKQGWEANTGQDETGYLAQTEYRIAVAPMNLPMSLAFAVKSDHSSPVWQRPIPVLPSTFIYIPQVLLQVQQETNKQSTNQRHERCMETE